MDILTYAMAKKYTDKQIILNNKNIPVGALKLIGQVTDITKLPKSNNKEGDVYIVGEEESSDKSEYYWFKNQWNYLGETPVDLSDYVKSSDIPAVMKKYGINSKTQISEMNTAINGKLSKSAIVKLDSMADFEGITDKTADWYFIKEG